MSVSVSCYQERRDCKSLLFSLLWYIGGAPPVLRNRGEGLLKARVTNVRWLLPLLILNCLFLSSSAKSHSPWCGQTLDQQVRGADMVARAIVVSRSRVEEGRYWATFRVDRILHSSSAKPAAKFLRLELSTRSGKAATCVIAAKVKPNGKYLVMVTEEGEKQGSQHVLSAPPLKSTKKLVREVKRILTGEEEKQKVRVRRGKVHQVPSGEPKVRQTTRLSCSARGNPPPTLYWTIDGRVLENSAATRIVTKNLSKFLRKSVLKLRGSLQQSSVHLQCHAFNSYGHTSKVKMGKMRTSKVRETSRSPRRKSARSPDSSGSLSSSGSQAHSSRRRGVEGSLVSGRIKDSSLRGFRTSSNSLKAGRLRGSPLSPLLSSRCPIPDYCLNGGTCQFYSTLGEQTCQCAKGYRGKRCERKYVSTGNLGAHMSDRFPLCLLGIAHYPCQ